MDLDKKIAQLRKRLEELGIEYHYIRGAIDAAEEIKQAIEDEKNKDNA